MRKRIAFATCAILAGCQAILGIEDTNNDPDLNNPSNEAGSRDQKAADDGTALVPNDAGDVPNPNDSSVILPSKDAGDDGGEQPIPEAGTCRATSTFDPISGATGTVCNPNAVVVGTGFVGLDYTKATQSIGSLDGRPVSSCIGASFGKPLTQITVRAGSLSLGCDKACVPPNCGTGHEAYVFAGNAGVLQFVGELTNLSTAYADFTIGTPGGVTQIAVCRTGSGESRDDVKINQIYGLCN